MWQEAKEAWSSTHLLCQLRSSVPRQRVLHSIQVLFSEDKRSAAKFQQQFRLLHGRVARIRIDEDPVAELVEMAPLDPEPSHEPEPESVAPAIDPAQVEDVVSESTDEVLDELAIAPSPAEPEPEPEPVAM